MKQKLLFILLLMAICASSASAYDFTVDGVYYSKLTGGKVAVTYRDNTYNSYSGHVVLPPTVTYDGVTYPVVEISPDAFNGCKDLLSIDIQSPITYIGRRAFDGCSSLQSIDLPETLKTMGHTVFRGCSSLTSMVFPDSLISIESNTFWDCTNLQSIHIGKSLSSIGGSTLSACDNLTTITVDAENQTFDSRDDCNAIIETATNTLFLGCKTTVIPNTVEIIGERAMYFVSGIEKITIPNSVKSIGKEAMSGMDVRSLVIPNSVETIGDWAFASCCYIEVLVIGESVKYIGEYAFDNAVYIRDIICWASCPPVLGENAFCPSFNYIPSLIVPMDVVFSYWYEPGWNYFNCEGISSDEYEMGADGLCYKIENGKAVVTRWLYDRYSGDVVIPNVVTHNGETYPVVAVQNYAFYDCYDLNSVVMGDSVEVIQNNAFEYCKSLKSVTFGRNVKTIQYEAFSNCVNLENVSFDNSLESIGEEAFSDCRSLAQIVIPANVTRVDNLAFFYNDALTKVVCKPEVPPTSTRYAIFDSSTTQKATLFVPLVSLEAYQNHIRWKAFSRIVPFVGAGPGDVNGDGSIAISDVTNLIDQLLSGEEMPAYIDVNGDGAVTITDVTALIDMLLSGN